MREKQDYQGLQKHLKEGKKDCWNKGSQKTASKRKKKEEKWMKK